MTKWIALIALCFLPSAFAEEACRELSIGETRVSESSDGGESTGLAHGQEIKRIGERSFRLQFSVKFVPGFGFPHAPAEIDSSFRERVNACLAEFNPQLKAKDSEGKIWKLELGLAAGSKLEPRVIEVVGPGMSPTARWRTRHFFRANSLSYPFDISCQTMVHELLHLGGLVDEYNESRPFPCRATGPLTSTMSNEYLALGSTVQFALQPAHIRALVYPGCEEKNAAYYRCASQAYAPPGCSPLPRCSLEDGWLR